MTGSTLTRWFALLLVAAVSAACSPIIATRGNLVDDDRLGALREGVSRTDDVEAALGTPTAKGTFNPNIWYYIGQRTEKIAFFNPDVVERKIVVFHFDGSGVLRQVEKVDPDSGNEVEVVDRVTPTAGKDMTFLQQLLGNVGRFGGVKKSSGPGVPGGTTP